MLLLSTLACAFAVLTLLVVGLLANVLRQRFAAGRRAVRNGASTGPEETSAATEKD
jgi:predicted outer membrane lipoprotein